MKAKDLTKPILILDRNYKKTTPNDEDTINYRKDLETLIKESSDKTITCQLTAHEPKWSWGWLLKS